MSTERDREVNMKKIISIVASVAAAAVLSLAGASAASADTAPASDGWKSYLPQASCLCFTWTP